LKQPKEIQLVDGRKIKHYYDGAGTLLKTIYYSSTNAVLETWDFNGGFIYKNGNLHEIQDDEGRIAYTAPTGGSGAIYAYEFNYKDHLGNTRVSFKANGSNLEKTAETAFDPWGVRMNIGAVNAFQNRFEFLNRQKESTFGLNTIRLGARGYNPTTGRFDEIDPVINDQEQYSTYQYGWNNPVLRSDANGETPCCGGFFQGVLDFMSGTSSAIIDDNNPLSSVKGLGLVNNEKGGAYEAGVFFGHGVAMVQGAVEMGLGGVADGGAVVLTPASGGSSLALTIPANAAIAHGAFVFSKAVANSNTKSGSTSETSYQTYTKQPKNTTDGVYSGKTSGKGTPKENIAKRDANHHMNKTHEKAKLDNSSNNSDAIRGREQNLIDSHGGAKKQGGTSGNQNRGVSKKNDKATTYENAAKKEFGN
jgi:RHS repeat-associated protein